MTASLGSAFLGLVASRWRAAAVSDGTIAKNNQKYRRLHNLQIAQLPYFILGAVTRFAVRNGHRSIDFPTSHCSFPLQYATDSVERINPGGNLDFLVRCRWQCSVVAARRLPFLGGKKLLQRKIYRLSLLYTYWSTKTNTGLEQFRQSNVPRNL